MVSGRRNNSEIFSGLEYVILIICVPLLQFFEFLFVNGAQVSETLIVNKSFLPYFSLVAFIVILHRSKYDSKQVFLLILLIFYIIFFDKFSIANNASYMISYILTCSLLLLKREKIMLSKQQHIIIVSVFSFLIIVYYLFAQEKFYEDRFYLVGFVIPHQFSYYCAIFTFYLLSRNKLPFAIAVTIAGSYVGARSGLLASLVCYAYYFTSVSKKQKSPIIIILLMVGILGGIYAAIYSGLLDKFASQFSIFFGSTNQTSSSDDTRTLLWLNMWREVSRDGFDIANIIGRGPRSSYAYNSATLGLDLWMHNDLVEILFTTGIIGLILYLFSFYRFYKNYKNVFFLTFIIVLISTNGFFTYIPLTMLAFFRLISSQSNVANAK